MENELKQFEKYLLDPGTENAKDHLVLPLFQKLFGSKFKKQSDAEGADTYIEGKLLVELKSDANDFLAGFYQGLHYAKLGLAFSAVCVVAQKFVAIWKINSIPDFAKKLSAEADVSKAPNDIGVKNARATSKAQKAEILKAAVFKLDATDLDGLFKKNYSTELYAFVQMLKNLDAERIQIHRHNFIEHIAQLEKFFADPIDAIHCFYAIVGFWDVTSTVAFNDVSDEVFVIGKKGSKASERLKIKPKFHAEFKKFVEQRFVFTNEGSGLTVDYYFSRFDEVITRIKPEYAKQHGIFFTDNNLSKFALWFVHEYFEKRLSDKYIVLDPAGGSGNLVTSWRGHLKRKIISELQPDLLKTIERRMKLDPDQLDGGFTIIPKTSKNEGLNFLDKSAEKYLNCLMNELKEQNFKFDKPIAFLLNPPYKNTDENEKERDQVEAAYAIDQSILDLTGEDAGRERYLAFLGQIINIARVQMGDKHATELSFENVPLPAPLDTKKVETPLILIFTPTSWLIPRPTYVNFRKIFDTYFKYETGFIILGNEFFKIAGRFPISFTIWSYRRNEKGNKNNVILRDLTHLQNDDLAINWNQGVGNLEIALKGIIKGSKTINYSAERVSIKKSCDQQMYDFKRDPTDKELKSGAVYGGLPIKDERRSNKKTYGISNSKYVGFMDDSTPVRVKLDSENRVSNLPDRVWFYLDNRMIGLNLNKIFSGPSDKYGMCAYDLAQAQKLFVWYATAKALNGRYPIWANQFDIWKPNIPAEMEKEFYSLCFAFGLAENRCVVTKFEKDNPVARAPEVLVDNPLCPGNKESFWSTTLDREIVASPVLAGELVALVKQLYKKWNQNYTKGQFQYSVGLQDEPYFKYFDYKDFVTPHSGLIQIRKYAEIHNATDLLELFEKISAKTKEVREEIYRLLVDEFGYFE
jgi:hypothetical protein